ncbi:MAG: PAS domain-containing sensor histidine kinase [Bacteroidota bacterium]|nr:PAS domain-containing sensor histidine kinase [Bacteroidota bacterium]
MNQLKTLSKTQHHFLSGGGEMGNLIRETDWSLTPLGDPESWPQSLRTMVGVMLDNPFGMYIAWGDEYTQLYNDGYRPILGATKHPQALGISTRETFSEIWHIIGSMFDGVMNGKAVGFPDFMLPLNRSGGVEECYFDFSYSPIRMENGKVGGVLVTVIETTNRKRTEDNLKESERRLRNVIEQASHPILILKGEELRLEIANEPLFAIWRIGKEMLGKPFREILPEMKGQPFEALLLDVFRNGVTHHGIEQPAYFNRPNGDAYTVYFNFTYLPYRESGNTISGVMVQAYDVTQQVEARKKIEDNEERLKMVLEASELGIWELDLKNKESKFSKRFAEIFGYTDGQTISHSTVLHHFHPDDLAIRQAAFSEGQKSGTVHYEARIIWNDGSTHWIESKGKFFYDDQKKPFKVLGTIRDSTKEKLHEQDLKEKEQKFHLLANSIPQHIWTSDEKGNTNYYNEFVFNYTGLTPAQVAESGWIQFVHPDDQDRTIKAWQNAVSTGKDFLHEQRFRRYDGEYRWQLSRAVPQRDASNEIQMWVGTSMDIQEIKELDQKKDFFISMASHELKTPLTSIKGYVQILQSLYEDSDDDFLKKSLKNTSKQIVKLTNLISDLLDLSKIKSGGLFLNKEEFQVNDLVEEIIEEIKYISPEFNFFFSKQTEKLIYGDRERIGQVLINFLTNAVKYSPASGNININSVITDDCVVVSVQDFGIGINKNDHEKIFERFYRVEGRNEKTFPGFGIGLFIANEIIQRHHGKIGVTSEPGKGSTFYFEIPFVK